MKAYAPGRVNLIGDHTDYVGGLVLPMAIDLGTTIEAERWDRDAVRLESLAEGTTAVVPLDARDPRSMQPPWARFIAGVVAVLRPDHGVAGTVRTSLPLGAGLSSSSSLTVAVALALGFAGSPVELARACQRAEQLATGVPGGIMDQLTAATAVPGHALLIDCATLAVSPVRLPDDIDVVVVHSGERRALDVSAYARRRAECEAAEREMRQPLRTATLDAVERLDDARLRRRARHVVTENERVRAVARALVGGDLATVGAAMAASHASLRDDFEVSTPALDALAERLTAAPGVIGARLTGAGFGGCVIALAHAGARLEGRRVRAAGAAHVER
jgi:galactokinase